MDRRHRQWFGPCRHSGRAGLRDEALVARSSSRRTAHRQRYHRREPRGVDADYEPHVLESTPAVLSVGKRCMEEGWTFVWNPWKKPLLISPAGKKIHLKVHGNVPYLVENKNYAMPADAHVPGILPAGEGAAHHEEVRLPQESVGVSS